MSRTTPRLWNNRWSAFACTDKGPTLLPGGDAVLQLLHFRQLSSHVCLFHKKANQFLLWYFFSSMKTKSSDLCLDMIGGMYSTNEPLALTLVEIWDD